jgi:CheY-like chemotaxis protein
MGKRLLVVDDSPGQTKIVSRMAEAIGFTTAACNDPLQALDAFIDFRPDIVMVDMCMPEKDGIELLHEILLAELPVKIVVTSGHGEGLLQLARDVATFHASPEVASLRKPFRRAEFVEVLTRLSA